MVMFSFSSGYDDMNDVTIHQKINKNVESSDVYNYTVMASVKLLANGSIKFTNYFLINKIIRTKIMKIKKMVLL